jgi:hypothetical protein
MAAGIFALQACSTPARRTDCSGFFDDMEKKVEKAKDKYAGDDDKKKDKDKDKDKGKAKDESGFSLCKNEVDKYCKASQSDYSKLFDCLKTNKSKLTPPCKAAVASYKKK